MYLRLVLLGLITTNKAFLLFIQFTQNLIFLINFVVFVFRSAFILDLVSTEFIKPACVRFKFQNCAPHTIDYMLKIWQRLAKCHIHTEFLRQNRQQKQLLNFASDA